MDKFEGYLSDMGIKYTQNSKTVRLGGGQGSYASSTTYSIKIKHQYAQAQYF